MGCSSKHEAPEPEETTVIRLEFGESLLTYSPAGTKKSNLVRIPTENWRLTIEGTAPTYGGRATVHVIGSDGAEQTALYLSLNRDHDNPYVGQTISDSKSEENMSGPCDVYLEVEYTVHIVGTATVTAIYPAENSD